MISSASSRIRSSTDIGLRKLSTSTDALCQTGIAIQARVFCANAVKNAAKFRKILQTIYRKCVDQFRSPSIDLLQCRKHYRAPWAQRSGWISRTLSMPLNENLVVLTSKRLIACRQCGATADVSINNSHVKLMCPRCYKSLGSWTTTPEAVADMEAFVASKRQSK